MQVKFWIEIKNHWFGEYIFILFLIVCYVLYNRCTVNFGIGVFESFSYECLFVDLDVNKELLG